MEAEREVRVDGGVADIATDTHIYEVDRLAKWHEGVGQVLHYRDESGKQGVLVLILPDGYSDWVRLKKLERKRCKPFDIVLIVLVRADPLIYQTSRRSPRYKSCRTVRIRGSPPFSGGQFNPSFLQRTVSAIGRSYDQSDQRKPKFTVVS